MSWHYSQALVVEYLAENCWGGEQFAQSKLKSIPDLYSSHGKTTEALTPSQYGKTCAPLTDDHGEDVLTWFRAAFPVRTSAQPERAQESTENDQGFGGRWRELSVKYDRDLHSWKTHRCLWEEDLPWSSVTLPKWGTMQDGVCWEQMTVEDHTCENEFGSWPTPRASMGMSMKLETVAKCLDREFGASNLEDRLTSLLLEQNIPLKNLYMHPSFVEALMGWPREWGELKPLETGKFRSWLQQHGES